MPLGEADEADEEIGNGAGEAVVVSEGVGEGADLALVGEFRRGEIEEVAEAIGAGHGFDFFAAGVFGAADVDGVLCGGPDCFDVEQVVLHPGARGSLAWWVVET